MDPSLNVTLEEKKFFKPELMSKILFGKNFVKVFALFLTIQFKILKKITKKFFFFYFS
jgi:hypothetical protein